jgi:hypothetical protein
MSEQSMLIDCQTMLEAAEYELEWRLGLIQRALPLLQEAAARVDATGTGYCPYCGSTETWEGMIKHLNPCPLRAWFGDACETLIMADREAAAAAHWGRVSSGRRRKPSAGE